MKPESVILEKPKKAKGSAPGQYLGFGLQPVRMFFHLLSSLPNAEVGLEYHDDVSTHAEDGSCVLEQCKSALSHNPVSNWSVDLWKTFANWIENIENGIIDPEATIFRLYIVPKKTGKIAVAISEANTQEMVEKVIADIKKSREKLSTIPKCEAFFMKVMEAKTEILVPLFSNFELIASDEDPLTPIRNFLDATVRPDLAEEAIKWGIGDAKLSVEQLIRAGEPSLLAVGAFRIKFRAFIAKHDNASVLHSLTEVPSEEMVTDLMAQAPTFLKQLELVEASRNLKTRASSDFLRSSSDKTKWAEAGFIFEESLVEYDDSLRSRHLNLSTELQISAKDLPLTEQGRLLYSKCCQGPSDNLEGRVVPGHFLTGSLNSLADQMEIGWHPEYQSELAGDD